MQLMDVNYVDTKHKDNLHYHDSHEIVFFLSGNINVYFENKEQPYKVERNSIIIFPKFKSHHIETIIPEYKRFVIHMSNEYSKSMFINNLCYALFDPCSSPKIIQTGEHAPAFVEILSKMSKEFSVREPMYLDNIHSLFQQFLIELYRCSPQSFSQKSINDDMVKIQHYMENNYYEQINIEFLSKKFHISASQLTHNFKKLTGFSIIEYLIFCRLANAKHLLMTTDQKICDILEQCGFKDDSDFSRMFKTKVGMTPTEFRKKYFSRMKSRSAQ